MLEELVATVLGRGVEVSAKDLEDVREKVEEELEKATSDLERAMKSKEDEISRRISKLDEAARVAVEVKDSRRELEILADAYEEWIAAVERDRQHQSDVLKAADEYMIRMHRDEDNVRVAERIIKLRNELKHENVAETYIEACKMEDDAHGEEEVRWVCHKLKEKCRGMVEYTLERLMRISAWEEDRVEIIVDRGEEGVKDYEMLARLISDTYITQMMARVSDLVFIRILERGEKARVEVVNGEGLIRVRITWTQDGGGLRPLIAMREALDAVLSAFEKVCGAKFTESAKEAWNKDENIKIKIRENSPPPKEPDKNEDLALINEVLLACVSPTSKGEVSTIDGAVGRYVIHSYAESVVKQITEYLSHGGDTGVISALLVRIPPIIHTLNAFIEPSSLRNAVVYSNDLFFLSKHLGIDICIPKVCASFIAPHAHRAATAVVTTIRSFGDLRISTFGNSTICAMLNKTASLIESAAAVASCAHSVDIAHCTFIPIFTAAVTEFAATILSRNSISQAECSIYAVEISNFINRCTAALVSFPTVGSSDTLGVVYTIHDILNSDLADIRLSIYDGSLPHAGTPPGCVRKLITSIFDDSPMRSDALAALKY